MAVQSVLVNVANQIQLPGEAQKKTGWVVPVVVAVLALVGALGSAYITGYFGQKSHDEKPAIGQAQAEITFVGRVTSDTGAALQNATVIATPDESIGQPLRTDVNGQFQIQLPGTTKALRLTVDAPGFKPQTLQANVHRTGPEEIQLKPVTGHHTKTSNPSVQQPASSVAPETNNGIINNAPNQGIQNNCPRGDCDQTIHVNDPPELPVAGFHQDFLAAQDMTKSTPVGFPPEGQTRFHPGQKLNIFVSKTFDDPVFTVDCDNPCLIVNPSVVRPTGSGVVYSDDAHLVADRVTWDYVHHKIAIEEKMTPRLYLSVTVRSTTSRPVKVLDVASSTLP